MSDTWLAIKQWMMSQSLLTCPNCGRHDKIRCVQADTRMGICLQCSHCDMVLEGIVQKYRIVKIRKDISQE